MQKRDVYAALVSSNLRRARWLAPLVICLALIFVLMFWRMEPSTTDGVPLWHAVVIGLSLVLALWWAVVGAAANLARSDEPNSWMSRTLQVAVPPISLAFSVAYALTDQAVSPNITPYLIGSFFTNLIWHMRPRAAIAFNTLAVSGFLWGLHGVQADPDLLLSNSASGLATYAFGVFLAIAMWRRDTCVVARGQSLMARNAQLEEQQLRMQRLADRDALTGVYNRRRLLELGAAELRRAERRGSPTGAIMLDLDHFKEVNDVYGHQAGDAILKQVAGVMSVVLRRTDLVGRMGGEEFMVLLPDTGLSQAVALAEKLRRAINERPLEMVAGQLRVTASFGVSVVNGRAPATMDWLYATTDHALYEAKKAGRDRVRSVEVDTMLTASDYQRLRKS